MLDSSWIGSIIQGPKLTAPMLNINKKCGGQTSEYFQSRILPHGGLTDLVWTFPNT